MKMDGYFTRMSTFDKYPRSCSLGPVELAKRGYSYSHSEHSLYCDSCDLKLHLTHPDIRLFHARERPDCPVARSHLPPPSDLGTGSPVKEKQLEMDGPDEVDGQQHGQLIRESNTATDTTQLKTHDMRFETGRFRTFDGSKITSQAASFGQYMACANAMLLCRRFCVVLFG